jgi:hypothetical protein
MGKNRQLEIDIKAHELAKDIEKFTSSYHEAMSLIDRVKSNFEWARERTKVELPEYPIDRWGQKEIMYKETADPCEDRREENE